MMWQEVEEEYNRFVSEVEKGSLSLGEYFDEAWYEDEYSHNMIEEYQSIFKEKVYIFLHENHPGQYVVTGGACVYVLSLEEAERRNIYEFEKKIVS